MTRTSGQSAALRLAELCSSMGNPAHPQHLLWSCREVLIGPRDSRKDPANLSCMVLHWVLSQLRIVTNAVVTSQPGLCWGTAILIMLCLHSKAVWMKGSSPDTIRVSHNHNECTQIGSTPLFWDLSMVCPQRRYLGVSLHLKKTIWNLIQNVFERRPCCPLLPWRIAMLLGLWTGAARSWKAYLSVQCPQLVWRKSLDNQKSLQHGAIGCSEFPEAYW